MKRIISVMAAVLIGLTIIASSAIAGPATDSLVTCMADNTTGKDRKDMARWIFVIMSAHPEIQRFSKVSETDRDQLGRIMAAIVTRLLIEDCQVQAKLAMEKEGDDAPLKTAFGVMGKLAMQELMANPEVNSAATSFAKYLDTKKLSSAFSNK
jgi:hypothetical protein